MRGVILVLLFVFSAERYAFAERLPVASIDSQNFSKQDTAIIALALGIKVGESINSREVDEGIRALHKQGKIQTLFVDTETVGGKVKVTLRGNRLRVLHQLLISGVEKNVEKKLRDALELEEKKTLQIRVLAQARERARRVLGEAGYFEPQVEFAINDLPGTQEADVELKITTGPSTQIEGVTVTGAPDSEIKDIIAQLRVRKGDVFSRTALEEDVERINKFFVDNNYPTSRVEDTRLEFSPDRRKVAVTIVLTVTDKQIFRFQGNTVFDDVELRELLVAEILSQSDASDRIAKTIRDRYRAVGFHFCEVAVKKLESAPKVAIVRFEIQEGPRVIIDGIEFKGIEPLTESDVKHMFFETAPAVVSRRLFWEEGVKEAANKLGKQLEAQGFLRATVIGPRTFFSEDKKGVRLYFDVDMGAKTFFHSIDVAGNTHFKKDELIALLPFKTGDAYSVTAVEEGKKKIIEHYLSAGFADVKWENVPAAGSEGKGLTGGVQISPDGKQAWIRLELVEGPRYLVGEIRLDGNKKTEPETILREMKVKSGDLFVPALVRQSEEEIQTLGLFNRVEIIPTANAGDPNKKDLLILVRESPPGLAEVGLGGTYQDPRFRLRSFLGFAYRNVAGLNQTASLRNELRLPFSRDAAIPFIEYSSVLGYRAPYPFNLPFTFVAQVGLDRYEASIIGPQIQTRAQIEGRIEKKLSQRVQLNYRLFRYEFSRFEILGDPNVTRQFIGSTGPGVIFDLRDDIFNPTKGSYHTFDFEFAHPFLLSQDNISFAMALSRNTFYVPVTSTMVLATYVGVGYAYSLFRNQSLPRPRLVNDLALGGPGTIRGFGVRRFVPPDGSRDTAFYNIRTELTVPLFANFAGAVFLDTGRIFPNLTASDANPRHDGVGVGIRYKTPVGPIVIDVAQGLGADRENVKFSLTVGTL